MKWLLHTADVLADLETPLTAYRKLCHDEPICALLESVTGGEHVARYSVIGLRPKHVLRTRGRRWSLDDGPWVGFEADEDALDILARHHHPLEVGGDFPPFVGSPLGMIGYDFVRQLEHLPVPPGEPLPTDDVTFFWPGTLLLFDHARNTARLMVIAEPGQEATAQAELARVKARLAAPLPPIPVGPFEVGEMRSNTTQAEFESAVREAKELIAAGDCIQVVLSHRLSGVCHAPPVALYRALRASNPSPFMFLMRLGTFDLVGASPELPVSYLEGVATVRPIAGTRPRGANSEEDAALADGLLKDEKERAEHIMLVDLGRNDLGKVAGVGSVRVEKLMTIERYSHVMHIVSEVTASLRSGRTVLDLVRSTFPAGTLSGAPKVRAMEIIDALEGTPRGPYGGAVGFLNPAGETELAILIRTIVLTEGMAHLQAGARIVLDSDPTREWNETLHKAGSPLAALRDPVGAP